MNKVLIAGGGAAGMMAAVTGGKRRLRGVHCLKKMKNWARRYLSQEKVVAI